MTKPIVVIVCPKEFRFTDTAATVETPFLTDVADLRTVWLDFNAPIPEEVLAAALRALDAGDGAVEWVNRAVVLARAGARSAGAAGGSRAVLAVRLLSRPAAARHARGAGPR